MRRGGYFLGPEPIVWVGAGCAGRLLADWLNDGWAGLDGGVAAGCGLLAGAG
jgi:hypothetical protein